MNEKHAYIIITAFPNKYRVTDHWQTAPSTGSSASCTRWLRQSLTSLELTLPGECHGFNGIEPRKMVISWDLPSGNLT